MTRPFVEDRQYEQGELTDEFYATGSSPTVGKDMWTFAKPLRDKEVIKLSFPVTSKTTMLPNSSSIYYFNLKNKSWNIPSKALVDHTSPFEQVAMFTGLFSGRNLGSNFFEDTILFDFKGRSLVSGSLPIFRAPTSYTNLDKSQKIKEESFDYGSPERVLNFEKQGELISKDFPKSCQRNEDYGATSDEVFNLPVEHPFLVEKVVVEIPFCLGPSWFNDKTSVTYATSSFADYTLNGSPSMGGFIDTFEVIDQGGPCLTFALFSQKNYGTSSIRDLISKSTITHEDDLTNYDNIKINQKFSGSLPNKDFYYINVSGMSSGEIDHVVKQTFQSGNNKYFTGSLFLKSIPTISNGCRVINYSYCSGSTGQIYLDYLNKKLGSSYLKTRTTPVTFIDPMDPFSGVKAEEGFYYDEFFFLSGIDTFGRGMTGFSPSGGSIFGGEYVSIGKENLLSDGQVKNPFYIKNNTERSQVFNEISSSILTGRDFSRDLYVYSVSDLFLGERKNSPYLLYPGEQLVLSISKTRPAYKNFKVDVNTSVNSNARLYGIGTHISSSYYNDLGGIQGHDVQFNTGSINITLYGSYVRAGNSYVP
jgi:hypothetical protein